MTTRRRHVSWWAAGAAVLLVGAGSRPAAAQSAYQFQADENQAVDTGSVDDGTPPPPENVDGVQVPDEQIPDGFEEQLAPYGNWTNLPDYGWVWQPNESDVGSDFTPYESDGDWDYTDDGWYFNSDYAWGGIPFHYGRWFWESAYGWLWLPGTTWGPSWVAWRSGGGYVGWAPLGPPGYHWGRHSGANGTPWCFLEGSWFGRAGYRDHLLTGASVRGTYEQTTPVRNVVNVSGARWNAGPRVAAVGQMGGNVAVSASRRPDQVAGLARVAPSQSAGGAAVPRSGSPGAVVRPGPSGGGSFRSHSSVMRASPYRSYAYRGGYSGYSRSFGRYYSAPASASRGYSRGYVAAPPAAARPTSSGFSGGGYRGGGGFHGGGHGGGRR